VAQEFLDMRRSMGATAHPPADLVEHPHAAKPVSRRSFAGASSDRA
jgi:hypothetical protein